MILVHKQEKTEHPPSVILRQSRRISSQNSFKVFMRVLDEIMDDEKSFARQGVLEKCGVEKLFESPSVRQINHKYHMVLFINKPHNPQNNMLLAQAIGLFLVIGGFSIAWRHSYFIPVVGGFVEERMLRLTFGVIEVIAGAFLVFGAWSFSSLAESIITILGLMMLAEGTFYFLASDKALKAIIKTFNKKSWYTWSGTFCVLVGIYLMLFGFNFI